ncbi:MAG: hypothetical protein ABIH20_03935 [Candidatus Diapherotrites archaeon]
MLKKIFILTLLFVFIIPGAFAQAAAPDPAILNAALPMLDNFLNNPGILNPAAPDFATQSHEIGKALGQVVEVAADTSTSVSERGRAMQMLSRFKQSTNPAVQGKYGETARWFQAQYSNSIKDLSSSAQNLARQAGKLDAKTLAAQQRATAIAPNTRLWGTQWAYRMREAKALGQAANYKAQADALKAMSEESSKQAANARSQLQILKNFAPGRGLMNYFRSTRDWTVQAYQYNKNLVQGFFAGIPAWWVAFKGYTSQYVLTPAKAAVSYTGGAISSGAAYWTTYEGVGLGAGSAFGAAQVAGTALIGHVIVYNSLKAVLISSTADKILYPPDVIVGTIIYNPVSKNYTFKYLIEPNRELNIERWDYVRKYAFDFSDKTGWWGWVQQKWLWVSEFSSLNLIDIGAGVETWMDETESLTDSELIWGCRLMVYKVQEGAEGQFKERDSSFEPVIVPVKNCAAGYNTEDVDLMAALQNQTGEFEAIMFVNFDPRIILFSADVINGKGEYQNYEREVTFLPIPGAGSSRSFKTSFKVNARVWEHALDDYARQSNLPPIDLAIAAPTDFENDYQKAIDDYEGTRADVMAIVGMPSLPHYFNVNRGNAIIDFRRSLSGVDYFDTKLNATRRATAGSLKSGLVSIVNVNTGEEYDITKISSSMGNKFYLIMDDISPGEYILTSVLGGYKEVSFKFTVEEKNYVNWLTG